MPMPRSERKSTCENLTAPAPGASIRHTSVHERGASAPASPPCPHEHPRPRALRRPLRRADHGDALLGDARPDGDHRPAGSHLAGRRPAGHLDLPAQELRRADDPDRPGVRRRGAPVRADRGLRRDQGLHRRGDGRGGDAARPPRRHRHHRRPAGDRPRLQDAGRSRRRGDLRGADLPGRGAGLLQLPGRGGPGRVRRRRDADRRARATARRAAGGGAAAEVHLHGAELPEPGRGDDVARAAAAAGRAGAAARAAGRRGQPLRAAALRRRAAAAALPARRRRLRHLHRHLLEDPLARDPAGLGGGAAAGDGEDRARQAGGRPLHLHPDPVLRPRVLRRRPLAPVHRRPGRALPRPPRRDAGGAARALPGGGDLDRARGRPLHLGDPARVHRHRRPAGQGAARRRRLRPRPGRLHRRARPQLDAPQLLRRRRGRDPRGHPPHRQGHRRAGRALRRPHRRATGAGAAGRAAAAPTVLPFRKTGEAGG